MINIRFNTWETNSSSVHSITLCDPKDYEDWKEGKLLFFDPDWGAEKDYFPQFIKKEDLKIFKDKYPFIFKDTNHKEEYLYEDYVSFNQYIYNITGGADFFEEDLNYKGNDLIAFGYAGYCG